MQRLGWEVEVDSFTEPNTVVGQVDFHNIVATLDPNAPRRLVLACHYDSKSTPAGFLGATDSAVPCSQMINLAHTMQLDLNEAKVRSLYETPKFLALNSDSVVIRWEAVLLYSKFCSRK